MTNALSMALPETVDAAPINAQQLRARLAVIQDVMRTVMVDEVDYGVIPGTNKPTLYKPGAEKLCVTFKLTAAAPIIEACNEAGDWSGDIRYRVQVPILAANGVLLAVGVGECSTGEEKYRWRRPVHENEFTAAPEDMRRVKWQRNGEAWQQVRVTPADVANTVLKMAHKRAYVHGVIMATAAGAIFTQDIEDLPEGVAQDNAALDRQIVTPPQRKSAAEPKGAGTVIVIDAITDLVTKGGQGASGPWTKTTITDKTGHKYSTFSTTLAAIAAEAWKNHQAVEVAYIEGKFGRDIQALSLAAAREPGAEG